MPAPPAGERSTEYRLVRPAVHRSELVSGGVGGRLQRRSPARTAGLRPLPIPGTGRGESRGRRAGPAAQVPAAPHPSGLRRQPSAPETLECRSLAASVAPPFHSTLRSGRPRGQPGVPPRPKTVRLPSSVAMPPVVDRPLAANSEQLVIAAVRRSVGRLGSRRPAASTSRTSASTSSSSPACRKGRRRAPRAGPFHKSRGNQADPRGAAPSARARTLVRPRRPYTARLAIRPRQVCAEAAASRSARRPADTADLRRARRRRRAGTTTRAASLPPHLPRAPGIAVPRQPRNSAARPRHQP